MSVCLEGSKRQFTYAYHNDNHTLEADIFFAFTYGIFPIKSIVSRNKILTARFNIMPQTTWRGQGSEIILETHAWPYTIMARPYGTIKSRNVSRFKVGVAGTHTLYNKLKL